MRCKHCGSACAEALPDELTTDEALEAIRQMADIGLKWVTLSGGEPLTRKDLPLLVKALSDSGVAPNIITNGWLITPALAKELVESGLALIAISVDGTPEIHDRIRRPGSFERLARSFAILRESGARRGAVTTVSKENVSVLPGMKKLLAGLGVSLWQVQLGLPMGNFASRHEWLLDPEQVDEVLDFCLHTNKEGGIVMYPADCLGYYGRGEVEARKIAFKNPDIGLWDGCNAGLRSFGLLHNGDVLGCTSIRQKEYIEGNLRERSLRSIWEDPASFAWRRALRKEQLGGSCASCKYGSKCLGGCANTRLTVNGSIYSENQFCSYNVALKKGDKEALERDFVEYNEEAAKALDAINHVLTVIN
jgi:radical SAM protein with 4Fe4S-binding SPASM domain